MKTKIKIFKSEYIRCNISDWFLWKKIHYFTYIILIFRTQYSNIIMYLKICRFSQENCNTHLPCFKNSFTKIGSEFLGTRYTIRLKNTLQRILNNLILNKHIFNMKNENYFIRTNLVTFLKKRICLNN